jgi:hypothetical protein
MSGVEVKKYIAFLQNFLPWYNSAVFRKPPTLIFAFGWYVKECVLDNLSVDYNDFDENLNPTNDTAKLSLRQV